VHFDEKARRIVKGKGIEDEQQLSKIAGW